MGIVLAYKAYRLIRRNNVKEILKSNSDSFGYTDRFDKAKKQMCRTVDAVDMDGIKLDTVSVRIGNQIFLLEKVENSNIDLESEIREEYKEKLAGILSKLKQVIIEKMDQSKEMIDIIRRDYEEKEQQLKSKLNEIVPMPNINFEHARRGLSVVKGNREEELIWLVRRVYWPKYVDRKPIKPGYIKKMITPIIVLIITVGKHIRGVSTRQLGNLDYFAHYHQSSPDCWGNWEYPKTWSTPEDILDVANQAVVVLENINSMSLAIRSPRGLPRFRTLERNVVDERVAEIRDPQSSLERTGIDGGRDTGDVEESIWTA